MARRAVRRPGPAPSTVPAWSEPTATLKGKVRSLQERVKELENYSSRLEQEKGYIERAVRQSMMVLESVGPVPAHYCTGHKRKMPLSSFRIRATRRGKWAIADEDGELLSFRPICHECESRRAGNAEAAHRLTLQQVVNRFVDKSPGAAEEMWELFRDRYILENATLTG